MIEYQDIASVAVNLDGVILHVAQVRFSFEILHFIIKVCDINFAKRANVLKHKCG